MAIESCFVIMAIGDQNYGDVSISEDELRKRYDDLIKEAINKAKPGMEVVRVDEISLPGTITTDIVTRIMHSNFVVADVTYPNPNVFYELGLRHACRQGTIIIKEKDGPKVPFDIAHLRYIEYENTPSGLKELSEKLKQYFIIYDKDPLRPDNHLLELAKLTKYKFIDYSEGPEVPKETEVMLSILQSPEIINMMAKQQSGEEINQSELMAALFSNPKITEPFITAMVKSGEISFGPSPNREARRKADKK
jgi:hypothetical protein